MGQRRFVLLGIGGVIALVAAITFLSLDDNLTYYLYPNEAVSQRADFEDGERFRLAGQVVEGVRERRPTYPQRAELPRGKSLDQPRDELVA